MNHLLNSRRYAHKEVGSNEYCDGRRIGAGGAERNKYCGRMPKHPPADLRCVRSDYFGFE